MLALTQPVSQEVTFFRDCRPAKMTRFPIENTKETLRSQADGIMRDPGVDNSATVNNNNPTLNNAERLQETDAVVLDVSVEAIIVATIP